MHVDYPNGDQVSYVNTVFGCEVIDGHLHTRDGEALDLRYYSESEISDINIAAWAATLVPHLFDREAGPYFAPTTWSPPHPTDREQQFEPRRSLYNLSALGFDLQSSIFFKHPR